MNRTIWDYDIQSDRVALLIRRLYWFIFIFLTPTAILGLIFFLWALFTHTPQTGVEKAEAEKVKVEKRIETVKNYYRY